MDDLKLEAPHRCKQDRHTSAFKQQNNAY